MDNLRILIEAPTLALQLTTEGLLTGALFALPAYGMALVWGVLRMINIVQGEWVMLGGFIALTVAAAGVPTGAAVPIAAATVALIGWASYRLILFRVVDRDLFVSILATYGLSILFQQLMNQLFGSDVRTLESGLDSWFLMDFTIVVSQVKVAACAAALALGVALSLFLARTRVGLAIRATAQDPRASRVLGVDPNRMYAITYALNAGLCGATGAIVVMSLTVHAYQGLVYTVRAFTIVVVGGLTSLPGVVGAAFGLGVAEQFAAFILGAQYQAAFVFVLLVMILMMRSAALARQRRYLK